MALLAERLAELSRRASSESSTLTVAESQEVTILADKDVPFIVVKQGSCRRVRARATRTYRSPLSRKPQQVASRTQGS